MAQSLTTWTCDFQTLRSNIFAKYEKFVKPFLPVHMGLRLNLLSKNNNSRKFRDAVPLLECLVHKITFSEMNSFYRRFFCTYFVAKIMKKSNFLYDLCEKMCRDNFFFMYSLAEERMLK